MTSTMNYDGCSLEELRSFVTSRGLLEEANRKTFITLLEQADKEPPPFRFEDLPPEIRNRVYEELLIFKTGTHKCDVQILATSKTINKEAAGLFYKINSPTITVPRSDSEQICVGTYETQNDQQNHIDKGVMDWPKYLLRFESLHISLGPRTLRRLMDRNYRKNKHARSISQQLYSLVSFLRQSSCLSRVTIKAPADTDQSSIILTVQGREDGLNPISDLCAHFEVVFDGYDPWPYLAESARADAAVNKDFYKRNVLLTAHFLLAEAESCSPLVQFSTYEYATGFEHVREQLEDYQAETRKLHRTTIQDNRLEGLLQILKYQLEVLHWDGLAEKASVMVSAVEKYREARQKRIEALIKI